MGHTQVVAHIVGYTPETMVSHTQVAAHIAGYIPGTTVGHTRRGQRHSQVNSMPEEAEGQGL